MSKAIEIIGTGTMTAISFIKNESALAEFVLFFVMLEPKTIVLRDH